LLALSFSGFDSGADIEAPILPCLDVLCCRYRRGERKGRASIRIEVEHQLPVEARALDPTRHQDASTAVVVLGFLEAAVVQHEMTGLVREGEYQRVGRGVELRVHGLIGEHGDVLVWKERAVRVVAIVFPLSY